MWDLANAARLAAGAPPLLGIASDDAHNYHGGPVAPGRGWIMVRAARLAQADLIDAMRAGDFYASSGVVLEELEFDRGKGTLTLTMPAEEGTTYSTQFVGARTGGVPGEVLATAEGTIARYTLKGDELYVRATVTSSALHTNPSFDGQHRQAWTQPVGWERHVNDPGPTRLRIAR
jgi:hypothetical protein